MSAFLPSYNYAHFVKKYFLWFFLIFGQVALASDSLLHVAQINLTGNKRTRKEIILREMTLKLQDTVSASRLVAVVERNRQNIYNLSLFNIVKIDWQIQQQELILNVVVKERWYIFASPYFDIEERNYYDLTEKLNYNLRHPRRSWKPLRLSYGAFVFWRNFTGRNEAIYLSGQTGFSQRIELDYTLPWAFPEKRIDLNASVSYIERKQLIGNVRQDTAAWANADLLPLTTSYRVDFSLRKRFDLFRALYSEVSYSYTKASDSLPIFNENYLQSSKKLYAAYPSISAIYTHDKRDIRRFPLAGVRYRVYARIAGILPGSTASFAKIGGSFAQHIPLSKRWNWAWGAQQVVTLGSKVPFYERNFLWIDKNEFPDISYELRGYQRYAVEGTSLSLLKTELKYAVFPKKIVHIGLIPFKKFQDFPFGFYLSGFTDLGYIANPRNQLRNSLQNRPLYGYGSGANVILFYDMVMRVEYTWNHKGAAGFNIQGTLPIK